MDKEMRKTKNTSLPSPFLLQKNKGILSVSSNLSSRVWVWRFFYASNRPADDDPRLNANRKDKTLMDYENFKEQFVEDVKMPKIFAITENMVQPGGKT